MTTWLDLENCGEEMWDFFPQYSFGEWKDKTEKNDEIKQRSACRLGSSLSQFLSLPASVPDEQPIGVTAGTRMPGSSAASRGSPGLTLSLPLQLLLQFSPGNNTCCGVTCMVGVSLWALPERMGAVTFGVLVLPRDVFPPVLPHGFSADLLADVLGLRCNLVVLVLAVHLPDQPVDSVSVHLRIHKLAVVGQIHISLPDTLHRARATLETTCKGNARPADVPNTSNDSSFCSSRNLWPWQLILSSK